MQVEGVGDCHAFAQQLAKMPGLFRIEAREAQSQIARHVGCHCHVAARIPHHQNLAARQWPAGVQHLERLAQAAQGVTTGDSRLAAERIEHRITPGQRAGMALSRAHGHLGAPGLDQRDRLASGARHRGGLRKALMILDALHVQAEGAHAIVRAEHLDQILERQARLIAHREDVANRHGTVVGHQGECQGPALADQRHAALGGGAHQLVRPQRAAIKEIDHAIAIGTEKAGRLAHCSGAVR